MSFFDPATDTYTFLGYTITAELAADLRSRGINAWVGHPITRLWDQSPKAVPRFERNVPHIP